MYEPERSIRRGEVKEVPTKATVRNGKGIREHTRLPSLEEMVTGNGGEIGALLEAAPDGIFVFDFSGTFLYGNSKAEEIVGYARRELIGKSFPHVGLLADGYLEKASRALALNIEGKPSAPQEFELVRKDGSHVWVEINTTPMSLSEQGAVIGFARDITDRKQAQEGLQVREQFLAGISEHASASVAVLNSDGTVRYMSSPTGGLSGYTQEELRRRSVFDLIHPDDLPAVPEELNRGIDVPNRVAHVEVRFSHKDGSWRYVDTVATNLLHDPRVSGIVINQRDVTERRQAEQALRESEERYRTIVEGMQDGYFEVDIAGNFTFFNESQRSIFGYRREELMGMNSRTYPVGENAKRVYQAFNGIYRTGKPLEGFRWQIRRKDGTKRFLETSAWLKRDSEGRTVGFCGVSRDITERVRMEDALRESEERYRTIVEDTAAGYYEVDLAGSFTFVSDSLCRMMGYSREELIGLNNRDYMTTQSSKSVYQAFNRVYRTGEPGKWISWEGRRKNGEGRLVETSAYPVRNQAGDIVGFRGMVSDVTERKRAEEQLLTASKLASIGELASGVAHELNNPLTGVVGYAQLLAERRNVPRDVKRELDKIHYESQRAARIVQNLLGFARQHRPEKTYFQINQLIRQCLELRSYDLRTGNIDVYLDLSPEVAQVQADSHHIEQVMLNLLANSEQAMTSVKRRGRLRVTTRQSDGHVEISVADNGPGIPEDQLSKVFDPFFTTKEVGKGTGLGLSICYGIVTQHGGQDTRGKPKRQRGYVCR